MATYPKFEGLITIAASTFGFSIDAGATSYVAAGDYFWETAAPGGSVSLRSAIQTILAAGVALSTATIADATGLMTIAWGSGVHSLDFNSTTTRDICGFAANIAAAAGPFVATKQIKGLWLPNVPAYGRRGHTSSAGVSKSDVRSKAAQSGKVWSTGYNAVRKESLKFAALTAAKTFKATEVTANESWERFYEEYVGAVGTGGAKPFREYTDRTNDASYLDSASVRRDWHIARVGGDDPTPTRRRPKWDGLWDLDLPDLLWYQT